MPALLDDANKTDNAVDAESAIENEIETALVSLANQKSGRIKRADHEIPSLYAQIKGLEGQIELYKKDRELCQKQLRVLDRRLAELRATR